MKTIDLIERITALATLLGETRAQRDALTLELKNSHLPSVASKPLIQDFMRNCKDKCNPIGAIKTIRALTGCDLKEAKDLFESVYGGL